MFEMTGSLRHCGFIDKVNPEWFPGTITCICILDEYTFQQFVLNNLLLLSILKV